MPKIVVPIGVRSLDLAPDSIQRAEAQQPDLLELRLDYMPTDKLDEDAIDNLLGHCKLPVDITIRNKDEAGTGEGEGYDGSEERRIELYQHAIDRGVAYIDIEALHYSDIDKMNTKIVVSHHKQREFPANPMHTYQTFAHNLYPSKADILKFAFRLSTNPDIAEQEVGKIVALIEQANRDGVPIAAMAMAKPDENGDVPDKIMELVGKTRLHTGNELAYACLSKEEKTAPGQYTVEQMRELLEK